MTCADAPAPRMGAAAEAAQPSNPAVPADAAAAFLSARFGVEGALQSLSSERDQNYLVRGPAGADHVLKIANANEDIRILELQNAALELLAATDAGLPVPRLRRSLAGRPIEILEQAGSRYGVRLLTALPGLPLSRLPNSPRLRGAAGRSAGRLDCALGKLSSDVAHPLLWDMRNAPAVRRFVALAGEARRLLDRVFDNVEARLPQLAALPAQWIHNDLNSNNLLAAGPDAAELSGIIDFGDLIRAPRIVEVAIVTVHQIVAEADPVTAAGEVVAAYAAVQPLTAPELALLPHLAATRLAMAVVLQLAHAQATASAHFNLSAHANFLDTIERLNRFGWTACSDRLAQAIEGGRG